MITDYWSVGLLSCSFVTLFLCAVGVRTGYRIFRFWDLNAHSELQVRLEEEVYLTAALVEFGVIIQLISVVMLILAADYFSSILVGAMCATGALTANVYGIPLLTVKLISLFFSAGWIVCHKLDISSEFLPLTKTKYVLLFFTLPILIVDATLLTLYLYNLEPDIITSCCGVLFSDQDSDGYNLLNLIPSSGLLILYGTLVLGLVLVIFAIGRPNPTFVKPVYQGITAIGLWIFFYFFSLVVITVFASPYIYAMPHHRCPFDLIKAPYRMTGYMLYFFLHAGVFSGLSTGIGCLAIRKKGLGPSAARLCSWGNRLSFCAMIIFLLIMIYHPLMYHFRGGEG